MLIAGLGYLLFAVLAVGLPGLAIQRLCRTAVDPALVVPLGLACCAFAWWAALVTHQPWLFPLAILALGATCVRPGWRLVEGPSLRGALPPFLALVAFFAVTEYGQNRLGPRGEFLFDTVVPEDTTFHVALAWELTVDYPPQVPGLSGVPMGYHNGLPLVRAAAARWAHVHPFDSLSRFEITLMAFAAVLALRAATKCLGGSPRAVDLVGWTLLATDFSFVFVRSRFQEAWLYLTDANLLFSLAHANSSVAATIIALAALVALGRSLADEGRGWLVTAILLSAALPHFKAFVAAHYVFGLGVAALFVRRYKEPMLLAVPALVGLAAVVLGPASAQMEVVVDPLRIAARLCDNLGLAAPDVVSLLLWGLAWTLVSLGLRLFGLGEAVRALFSRSLPAAAIAAMALSGWPIGLLFRVMPLDYHGWRPPYNEAWYFIEQSAPLLWIFTAIAASRLALPGWRSWAALAAAGALALPSTIQFAIRKHATAPAIIPPAIVEAMDALARVSRPGDVVLQRPEPKRYPPPPMVLIPRRVPFTRFIPYLYQVAPRRELLDRIELVRRFFKTTDPKEAVSVASALHARFVCLFGDDAVAFPGEGVLKPVDEQPNVKVYEIVGVR